MRENFKFMADTFYQVYLQFVFAVRNRRKLIPKSRKDELHKYITGLVQNRGSKMIAVHCMPDHAHIFVGFRPGSMKISDFVKEIKLASNTFINNNRLCEGHFQWQNGYGVFSYSHSHIDRVAKYVLNQEVHHKVKSFQSEYLEFLERFNVPYDEKYLFDFFE